MDFQLLLKQAVSLHQIGRLSDAERLYEQVLAANRRDFPARYQLALLLFQSGRLPAALQAAEAALELNRESREALVLHSVVALESKRFADALISISQVTDRHPGDPDAWHSRGVILRQLERHEEAVAAFDKAIAIEATPKMLIARGAALLALTRPGDALRSFDDALVLEPANAAARLYRGNALVELHRHVEAIALFDAILAQDSRSFDAWSNRGLAQYKLKRFAESLESYDKAMAIRADYASAWTNRADVLVALTRFDEALASYDQAIARNPRDLRAWYARAVALRKAQRYEEALDCIAHAPVTGQEHFPLSYLRGWLMCECGNVTEGLAVVREAAERELRARAGAPRSAPSHKAHHDAEQRAHLAAQGIELREGSFYFDEGGKLPGRAVNAANAERAQAQWQASRSRIVVIDNLLTADALAKLRRFCWNSTVWHRPYEKGYLGAMPEQGFACPLLAQIADELRETFPGIVADHPLRKLWAFKYDSRLHGIGIHADQAAVNVNFWIAPDESNRNQDSGGMVIWDVAAPQEWDIETYNGDERAVRAFLARTGAKALKIPHRANRAVIFDSDLFHETDSIDFHPGYLNRRINVTMLYGRRTYYGA
jgi:tetratricopeptide (TPR) repeat protein